MDERQSEFEVEIDVTPERGETPIQRGILHGPSNRRPAHEGSILDVLPVFEESVPAEGLNEVGVPMHPTERDKRTPTVFIHMFARYIFPS